MAIFTHTFIIISLLLNPFNNVAHASGLTNAVKKYFKLFTYEGSNRVNIIVYDDKVANEYVKAERPKGLHRTRLDLDSPQVTSSTSTIYRVVQFLLNGGVTELQRELYKDAELKVTGHGLHSSTKVPCKIDVVVKLTRPSTFDSTGNFTPQEEGMEQKFSLSKNESKVLKFQNVFDDDFPMDHFWANFTVKGRCNMYLDVELLKPNNTTDAL